MTSRIPTHPGEILKDELEARRMSANALAKALGVDAPRISEIIKLRRSFTPETAIRLAAYFGGSPSVWLRLQLDYDLARLEADRGDAIRHQIRPPVEIASPA